MRLGRSCLSVVVVAADNKKCATQPTLPGSCSLLLDKHFRCISDITVNDKLRWQARAIRDDDKAPQHDYKRRWIYECTQFCCLIKEKPILTIGHFPDYHVEQDRRTKTKHIATTPRSRHDGFPLYRIPVFTAQARAGRMQWNWLSTYAKHVDSLSVE